VGLTEEFVALVFLVVFAASQQPELLALPGTEECLLVYVVTEGWLLQTWLVQWQFVSGVFAVSVQKLLGFVASADSWLVAELGFHQQAVES